MNTKGFASSFADLADVRAFKRAKAKGMTDQEAFRYGDNGIGCFGDDVTTLKIPLRCRCRLTIWLSVGAA